MGQHFDENLSQASFGGKRKDFLNFAIETHARQNLKRTLKKQENLPTVLIDL